MTSQSFKASLCLSEEDAASIAALQAWAQIGKRSGNRKQYWEGCARASHVVNCSTLRALETGSFSENELLMFCDIPRSFEEANPGNKTVHLDLLLISGSPLAREIIEVLRKHGEDGSVI